MFMDSSVGSLTGQSHRQVQTQSNAPSVTHQLSTSEERLAIFPTPSLHPHPSSAAAHATDAYTSFLKSVYLRQKFPTYGKWHPDTSNAFINLAIIKKQKMSKEEMDHFTKQTIRGGVDDIVHEKESISMDEIGKAKGNMLPKFILVEGAPGVGKSTFAWKLCRKWSKGKLLHQYRLVVLLRLRDKRVRETKSVTDLFYYYNRQIQQTVVEEIQATGGRGVLLLFEGYDELPAKLRTSSSIFLEVITGKELPEATVLVTSRPSASGPLYMECRNFIDQHVEILGFTEKDIQSYFDRNMESSLLQELQQYLTYYPHITTMLYIPLNCAIVAEVYRVNKSSKSLIPKTWTELYSSLLRSLLLRYLDDHPVHQRQSWKSNNFRDLPADVYQRLCEVGTIAYEGILQGQQVIFSDLPSDFNSLGLMQCVPELYVDKVAAESFNFLHLTLQEYMAALHLSEQPVEKQIKLFHGYQQQKHGGFSDGSCTHLQTVLRFLAGLKKFRGYPNSSIHSLLANPGRSHESSLWISLDGLHWMFEATYSNACKAIEVSSVRVDLSRRVTTFDCFALGCCVSHSSCVWMVEFNGCGIGDEGVEMLVRGAMERETKHSGYISEMSMPSNNITGTGLNQLLKMPELQKLRLLDLSGNPLGRGGAVSLLKSPLIPNLEELVLASTEIGVEDCQALSELLPSSPVLQRINIRYNNLPPEAVEPIITALKNCTVLEKLQIGDSQFTLQNCISLGSLTHPPRKLNLQCCHIDDEGAIEVVRLLDQNTVTSLRLGGNPIGVKGASELAIKLLSNTSLIELELRHESIGHEGAQKLIASLSQNSTLERLDLLLKYKSSVDTSEAYRRVQNRIQWWKGKRFVCYSVLQSCIRGFQYIIHC